jgi:DNA-binding phage protein
MSNITSAQLHAYLDDALSEGETARVEQELRDSDALRKQLLQVKQDRDRGDHSLGAIWRRERLTCPKRETLNSYLDAVLDEAEQDYLTFHLETVGCPYCLANLHDLQTLKKESASKAKERRQRILKRSAEFLQASRDS